MSAISTIAIVSLLVGFIILGGGVFVWLAPVPADQITPAQGNLIEIADGMAKTSFGAILGFAGGRLTTGRSGSEPSG